MPFLLKSYVLLLNANQSFSCCVTTHSTCVACRQSIFASQADFYGVFIRLILLTMDIPNLMEFISTNKTFLYCSSQNHGTTSIGRLLSNELHSIRVTRNCLLRSVCLTRIWKCCYVFLTADWLEQLMMLMTFIDVVILDNMEL